MNIIYETPVLWAETSKGLKKFWQGFVAQLDSGEVVTYTEYWQEKADGSLSKKQTSQTTTIEAKNVGKSNETALIDQGISEMKSQMKKQIDKSYAEIGKVSQKLTLPMLAHKFSDYGDEVTYPASAQPKADGVRCLTDGQKMWSRKGILFKQEVVQHILDQLTDDLDVILDGELIMPHGHLIQETMDAVGSFDPVMSPQLLYRIYDVVMDKGYDYRLAKASEIVQKSGDHVKLMQTLTLQSEEDLWPIHEGFVKAGWEGTMVRDHKAPYKAGHRSHSLLKVKDHLDEEFECIGVKSGTGKFAKAAILICKTKEGLEFAVTPRGTMQYREQLLSEPEMAVGKQWTVRFQSWTADKIPFHARAINARDPDLQG